MDPRRDVSDADVSVVVVFVAAVVSMANRALSLEEWAANRVTFGWSDGQTPYSTIYWLT